MTYVANMGCLILIRPTSHADTLSVCAVWSRAASQRDITEPKAAGALPVASIRKWGRAKQPGPGVASAHLARRNDTWSYPNHRVPLT